jgi:hypothetical protein
MNGRTQILPWWLGGEGVKTTKKQNRLAPMQPEMEFLDIILTKDSSLLLHAIHSPFLLADFKENYTLL